MFPHNAVFGKKYNICTILINSSPRYGKTGFKCEKYLQNIVLKVGEEIRWLTLTRIFVGKEKVIQIQTFSALLGLTCHYGTSLKTASFSEVCFWGVRMLSPVRSPLTHLRPSDSRRGLVRGLCGQSLRTEMVILTTWMSHPSESWARNRYKLSGGEWRTTEYSQSFAFEDRKKAGGKVAVVSEL